MKYQHWGFTGTQGGLTESQRNALELLMYLLPGKAPAIHLGDCIGADEEAYHVAAQLGYHLIGHPPENSSKRAFLEYDELREPLPYMDRNTEIAREGERGLIACPKGEEERRSGTWATVRRARGFGRTIYTVWPSGKVEWNQTLFEGV